MFGPCWDPFVPSVTLRTAENLKFLRLHQHGIMHMSLYCVHFGTMAGPCFDHFGPMFGLTLLSDQLEL